MRRTLPFFVGLVLVTRIASAAPISAGDLASARASAIALESDPFAEETLRSLVGAYQRGPGIIALQREFQARAAQRPPSAATLIVLGRIELLRGRRADAVRDFDLATKATTDSDTLRRLGRLLDDSGATAEAIRAYQAGRVGATPVEQRTIALRLGALLLAQNKVNDAKVVWDDAKRLAPQDQLLRRQIAEAYAAHRAWGQGLAELKQIEPLVEDEPLAYIAVLQREADFARRLNDRESATRALIRAYEASAPLKQSPLRAELTLEIMRLYRADKSVAQPSRGRNASELVAVAEKLQASFPSAAALVGEGKLAMGDTPGAVAALRRASKAGVPDPYLLRRLCDLETGETRVHDLELLFDLNRNDPSVGLDLVGALLEAKRGDEAVARAKTVKDRFVDNALVLVELARLLGTNGKHAEALKIEERALQLDPDNLDAVVAYADDLEAVGRTADASKAYFRLVAGNASPTAYTHLITLLGQRKLPADLKRAYEQALAKQPDDHELRRDYARWLSSTKAYDQSLVQWKIILQQSKNAFLREFADREVKRIETQQLLDR